MTTEDDDDVTRAMPIRRNVVAGAVLLAMVAALLPFLPRVADAVGPAVFINEIHYDNASTDTGEGFEIAGPTGTNLAGWSVALYNGSNSAVYNTIALSGIVPNQQAGFGTLTFSLPTNGLQNGSPDGLALVDAGSVVVEFLSYEGTLSPKVTGVTVWQINADEADLIDYDTSFKKPAQDAIYAPDAYRSSDHDPVIVGLQLDTPMLLKEMARDDLIAALPTGSKNDDKFIGKAIDRLDESLNPAWWTGASTLDTKNGKHVFDSEHQAVVELEKVDSPVAQAAIDELLLADRGLALKQLLVAIVGGGDPAHVAKAQGNLADAAANIAAGDFANAVLDYKKAWTNAVKAE